MSEPIYYSSDEIDKLGATYNIIYGQRSNGKTFAICRKIIDAYIDEGLPSAYIRRLDEMIKPSNLQELFSPHADYIRDKTEGKYNAIFYRTRGFFLCRYEDGIKVAQDVKPFCRTYSLNTSETTKGQDAGEVKYICFDEFITRQFYLNNEFILFQNTISSILRSRSGARIYMLANTVSKYCPYFREMGLTRIKDQKQGTIDLYTIGTSGTKIAVEYCGVAAATAAVSEYYCFNNPEINMITSGVWEIALYRHIPDGIGALRPELRFFVVFDGVITEGRIYMYNDAPILCFNRKTTEIKDTDNSIIYADNLDNPPDTNPLHQTNLAITITRAHELIVSLLKQHKTYFATNEDGETVGSWLKWATKGALKV